MEHKIGSGDHHLAAVLEEDTQRRQDDGEEDVYAVHRALVRHFLLFFPSAETPLERALQKIGRKNREIERERKRERFKGCLLVKVSLSYVIEGRSYRGLGRHVSPMLGLCFLGFAAFINLFVKLFFHMDG